MQPFLPKPTLKACRALVIILLSPLEFIYFWQILRHILYPYKVGKARIFLLFLGLERPSLGRQTAVAQSRPLWRPLDLCQPRNLRLRSGREGPFTSPAASLAVSVGMSDSGESAEKAKFS